jgi:hypothetical protein
MVIKRSRAWVKNRIPSFICKETGWWVSRWVQCNVFLCPECRQEYKSLKHVWDELDTWQVDEIDGECEDKFIKQFRQQFPSAYEKEAAIAPTPSVDWLPTLAFGSVAALLLFSVMRLEEPKSQSVVRHVTNNYSVAAAEDARRMEVAERPEAPLASARMSVPTRNVNFTEGLSSQLDPRVHFSTISPQPRTQQRLYDLDGYRRTIEINNMPVPGFESLTSPYEQERPY